MQRQQSDKGDNRKQGPDAEQNKAQGAMPMDKQGKKPSKAPENYMTDEDIPESTNVSDGVPGSGKRQDTN